MYVSTGVHAPTKLYTAIITSQCRYIIYSNITCSELYAKVKKNTRGAKTTQHYVNMNTAQGNFLKFSMMIAV